MEVKVMVQPYPSRLSQVHYTHRFNLTGLSKASNNWGVCVCIVLLWMFIEDNIIKVGCELGESQNHGTCTKYCSAKSSIEYQQRTQQEGNENGEPQEGRLEDGQAGGRWRPLKVCLWSSWRGLSQPQDSKDHKKCWMLHPLTGYAKTVLTKESAKRSSRCSWEDEALFSLLPVINPSEEWRRGTQRDHQLHQGSPDCCNLQRLLQHDRCLPFHQGTSVNP